HRAGRFCLCAHRRDQWRHAATRAGPVKGKETAMGAEVPLLGKGGVRGGSVSNLIESIRRLTKPPLAPPLPRRGIFLACALLAMLWASLAGLKAGGALEVDVPLLPDGTVSFGPAPGEDGVWELSYVENMADHVISPSSKPSVGRRSLQRSAAAEPHVPFM